MSCWHTILLDSVVNLCLTLFTFIKHSYHFTCAMWFHGNAGNADFTEYVTSWGELYLQFFCAIHFSFMVIVRFDERFLLIFIALRCTKGESTSRNNFNRVLFSLACKLICDFVFSRGKKDVKFTTNVKLFSLQVEVQFSCFWKNRWLIICYLSSIYS